jgi:ABC-type thiamine transport system substrate-binding protein
VNVVTPFDISFFAVLYDEKKAVLTVAPLILRA